MSKPLKKTADLFERLGAIAMHKVLGGFNVKKAADLNAVLLVKLVRRMLCEPDASRSTIC